jgi:hypothetical protein
VQIDVKEWRDEEPGVLNVTALQPCLGLMGLCSLIGAPFFIHSFVTHKEDISPGPTQQPMKRGSHFPRGQPLPAPGAHNSTPTDMWHRGSEESTRPPVLRFACWRRGLLHLCPTPPNKRFISTNSTKISQLLRSYSIYSFFIVIVDFLIYI